MRERDPWVETPHRPRLNVGVEEMDVLGYAYLDDQNILFVEVAGRDIPQIVKRLSEERRRASA